MKRNASLAAVLLVCLALAAGCSAPGVSSASECGQSPPSAEPARAAPGEAFRLHGGGFADGCDDTGPPFLEEPARRDIGIGMCQGGRSWTLASGLAATGPPDYALDVELEVPEDAKPGAAVVSIPDPNSAGPMRVPFEVLGAPAEAYREPAGTASTEPDGPARASNGKRGEPDASACAAGKAPVDLAAEGTVQGVKAGPGFSLYEIRVERVLEGNAGDTVRVKTNSGTRMGIADDVVLEEGARYRLRLQREDELGRGTVYSTNVCLGTDRLE